MNDVHQRVEAVLAAFAKARSWSSPTTTTARTRATCSSRPSLCTPEKMAFIIRNTSGIVCAPLAPEEAKRLHLDPMVALNDAPLGTAFTVSVDVPPRPHHRHLGRGAQQHGARARQRQQRRRRFRAPRPRLSAGRQGGRRADALRPYRGLRRSLPARRPAAGRRAGRADERRRHRDARPGGRGLRRAAQAQAHFDRRPDRLPAGARQAGRAGRRVPGRERDRHAQRAMPT